MGRQFDGDADAGGDTGRDEVDTGAEVGQDGDGLDGDGDGGCDGDGDGDDGLDGDGDGDVEDDGDGADDGRGGDKDAEVKFSPEQQRAVNGLLAKESRRRKEAERQLGEASRELEDFRKRYGEADSETVLSAARSAGVMPELMTAAEADGVTKLDNAKANAKYFSRLMRRSGEEFDVGGKKMSRADIEDSADYWEEEAEKLESRFSGVKARVAGAAQEIWRLGMAARKAGWKPGLKSEGGRMKAEGGKLKAEGGGRRPGGRTEPDDLRAEPRKRPGGGRVDWGKVSRGELSLEDAIAQSERGGKG